MQNSLNWSPTQSRAGFPQINLALSPVTSNLCPKEPACSSSKYRSVDGSCNNLENKSWGQAMTGFNRLLHPNYADGFDKPRVAGDGNPLPSAREVSILLAPDKNSPNRRYTLMAMQFGQFLDHDLTRTAGTRSKFNSKILIN